MRVLIAHAFYRIPGGEDRYVREQVDLLSADHDVKLLAANNDDLPPGAATAVRMAGSRSTHEEVERTLRSFAPHVVHLHNPYPAFGPAVHLACRRTGTPLVVTVHNYRLRCPNGLMFTEGEVCRRCVGGNHVHAVLHDCFPSRTQGLAYGVALWVHRFVRRIERDVSLFIAPSAFVLRSLIDWGVDPSKVRLIRNFATPPSTQTPPSGEFGVFLGRLSSEKGIDVLLRALEEAGDPPFRIVGDGPSEASLRALAAKLALSRTEFLGRVDRATVDEVLSRASYLALPSIWYENAPLAAIEAMFMGVPLLVTDTGGLPELVADGGGIICAPGDPSSLARGIHKMEAEAERLRLGDAARRFAQANLTPATHKSGLESAYETLVGANRP